MGDCADRGPWRIGRPRWPGAGAALTERMVAMSRFFSRMPSPCVLGLAFVHMWIYCSTHRFLESGGLPLTAVLYASMGVALIAMLAVFRVGGASSVGSSRALVGVDLTAASLMAVGGVALSVGTPLGPMASTAVGAVLGGVGLAWAYGRWIQVYCRMDLRLSAPLLLVTMALGSACKTVIDFLPGFAAAAAFACLPFAAFACARVSSSSLPEAPEPVRYYNEHTVGSLSRVVASVVAFSLVIGIVRTSLLEETPEPYALSVLVNHLSEIIIALALLWWVGVRRRDLDFGGTWRIILILIVTVLVFEPLVADSRAHTLLLALVRTAHALLIVFFLFLAVADVARHSSYSPLAVYCVGWLAYALPFAAGSVLGAVLSRGAWAPFVPVTAAWALVVIALVLLDDRSLGNQLIFAELNQGSEDDTPAMRAIATQRAIRGGVPAAGGGGPAPQDPLHEQCARLASRHGLTGREAEILELLARGHGKARIAETFLIAENTVRSHTKHIYAKLDVHSKQELLDLVESVEV